MPKTITVPVVDGQECVQSHDGLNDIASKRTFCAGNNNGEGPCKGDSGGGFAMLRNGRWTLRGTVSASLGTGDPNMPCNLQHFVVYSDVAKFIPWIRSYLIF